MAFSETFIRKPVMTTLSTLAAVLFGIGAYFTLPISDLPSVDYPVMTISVGYPGASPATMASTVASPLENECMQIPGLQSVISQNTEGQTLIILTFDLDRNVDLVAPDVQAAISRAMGNLPTDLPAPPVYSKHNPSDEPILYLMLSSDTMTMADLYELANQNIGKKISMINGVSQVQIYGAKAAVRVMLDPVRLAALGLGINEVAGAITEGTVTIPAGSLNGAVRTFSIEPQGQLMNAAEYGELIVAYRDGGPIRLKDVGRCVDSVNNDIVNLAYGKAGEAAKPGAILMPISRQGGANTVAVAAKIKHVLAQAQETLPGSVQLIIFYDKAVQIIESVDDVKFTIILALALVVMVIFLFLGRLSDTVIPAVTLPLSIVTTFIIMKAAGFSLDNLSLMGLTLCVGFLVDDAIVVLENTVRHIEKGEKPFAAALGSMKEITGTVVSTSVALMIVFVPLIFMGGVVGKNFKEFAVTVVAAIFCSMVLALTLSPLMCSRMLKSADKARSKLQDRIDRIVGGMIRKYGVALKWVLQHRIVSVIAWLVCILGTLLLFAKLPKTFMPEGDSGFISGQMVMQQGTSTEQINDFQDKINAILSADDNVFNYLTVSGIQPGADQSSGPFFVALKPREHRKPMREAVQELQAKLMEIADGFAFLKPLPSLQLSAGGESTAAGSKYSYTITGMDMDLLYQCAQELENKMNTLPGFIQVQSSVKLTMPQLKVHLLRDRASTLGITAKDVEYALALAYAQGRVTTFKSDVDQYDVIVQLDEKHRQHPENLATIYLRSPVTGKLVPLQSVAKWEQTVGPQNVPHSDQMNSATLSFSLTPNIPLGNATKALQEAAETVLPPGVTGRMEGEAQEFEDAIKSLAVLMLVAVFLMYIILGILYESYIHPFTVLTTLPVAAFGGLLTLLVFGAELSIYAYIGMFMLLGIVAKNGIMMVDFANQELDQGKSGFDAIYNACLIRFRPILMTGLAAIMGAVPIAIGYGADGESRIPLGLIVVGGLIFAQVITLFVTPGVFLYMNGFQERFLKSSNPEA